MHLTNQSKGELLPSALIPFCSYKSDHSLVGEKRPELRLPICNKFEPIILEGQLCYSLDVAKTVRKSTKAGKANGIFLLVDTTPYRLDVRHQSKEQLKVYFHTLAQDAAYGSGTYALSNLKRMTGTESFQQLPENKRRCLVHNREMCQTKKFLDQVQSKCNCVPWALVSEHSSRKVVFSS